MAATRAGAPALLGWLAALIAPPIVAGSVWRSFYTHHLVLAALAAVLYWVAVAVVKFIVTAGGELESRYRARLVGWADLTLQWHLRGIEGRYRELVLANLRHIDQKGLNITGSSPLELAAVFVDVTLIERPVHAIEPGVVGSEDRDGRRHAIEEFLGGAAPARLAVIGRPGSGKTTLLRHTAWKASLGRPSRGSRGRDLPVLLYLRDHAAAITAAGKAPTLAALMSSTLGNLDDLQPAKWLERKLRSGACVVLLDGLDEVARQEDRAKVAEWAEGQVRQYPGNDFLITSRPLGYQAASITDAVTVQVCGFTSAQVDQFVRGWYRAIDEQDDTAGGHGEGTHRAKGADDLLRRLDQVPALRELTVNPLLLTMIANVHRYKGELPDSRADLYAEICQTMIVGRQKAKRLAGKLEGTDTERVLRALAYEMMTRQVSDLDKRQILDLLWPMVRDLPALSAKLS